MDPCYEFAEAGQANTTCKDNSSSQFYINGKEYEERVYLRRMSLSCTPQLRWKSTTPPEDNLESGVLLVNYVMLRTQRRWDPHDEGTRW